MARVTFSNGTSVNFNGNPTPQDVEHVATQIGIKPGGDTTGAGQMGNTATAAQSGYGGFQPPSTIGNPGPANAPKLPDNPYGTPFSVTGNESPLEAAGKYVGNIPTSAAKLGGGLVNMVTHPVQTVQGLGGLAAGGATELGHTLGIGTGQPKTSNEDMFDSLIHQYKSDYFTSPENTEKKIVEDPAGFMTDLATLFVGGGGGAAKAADFAQGTTKAGLLASKEGLKTAGDIANSLPFPIESTIKSGAIPREAVYKTGNILTPEFAQGRVDDIAQKLENFQQGLGDSFRSKVDLGNSTMDGLMQKGKDVLLNETKGTFHKMASDAVARAAAPIVKTGGVMGHYLKDSVTSTLSHITGLEPSDVRNIFSNPKLFSKASMDATTRSNLTGELSDAIDQKVTDLGEQGQQYSAFRQQPNPVNVSQQGYINSLKNKGIGATFDPKTGWNLSTSKESVPISEADKNNIVKYLNQYASEDTHTGNSFLNARSSLAQMAKYEVASGKTGAGANIARDFRSYLNTTGRPQIPGLEDADAKYEPLINDLNQIKDDFVNKKTGDLKDNAETKLANAGNKPQLLARVEKVIPGITEKLQHLKTIENIAAAKGNKVGNYARAFLESAGLVNAAGWVGGAALPYVGGPAGIALWIMANPGMSVPILRGMGYSGKILDEINHSAAAMAPVLQGLNLTNRQGLIPPASQGNGLVAPQ